MLFCLTRNGVTVDTAAVNDIDDDKLFCRMIGRQKCLNPILGGLFGPRFWMWDRGKLSPPTLTSAGEKLESRNILIIYTIMYALKIYKKIF